MNARLATRGMMLMEALVYIAVFQVILATAFPPFYQVLRSYQDLQRNADDIVRVVQAGERWREDIRGATSAPHWGEARFHIPTAEGEVVYSFSGTSVWRQAGGQPRVVLPHVKQSVMLSQVRQPATVWRWELELESPRPVVRLRPLFSFQAVAGGTS